MSTREIVVVDYHRGNLQSVARGIDAVGGTAAISDNPARIARAAGVILPGVGSFEDAMDFLTKSGEADALVGSIERGVPFLGICLGLQLLFERGNERSRDARSDADGQAGASRASDSQGHATAVPSSDDQPADEWVHGLGIFKGSATKLVSSRLKVPHVGWDQIHLTRRGRRCPLLVDVPEGTNAYFTHSYALADDVDGSIVCTRTHYVRSFASAVWKDNVFGVQFHPEKSSAVGLDILSNFVQVVRG